MKLKKGEMAEWLKAPAWKACILLKVSSVNIHSYRLKSKLIH